MSNESEVQTSYDIVADEYAKRLYHELDHKPFDRKMLDWLAEQVGKAGVICDPGCGPGQVARYLSNRRAKVCGIDLSSEMVKQAQRLNPNISFAQGNMLALDEVAENSFAGIAITEVLQREPYPEVEVQTNRAYIFARKP